ncbi:sensor domain-containing protein [Streptomyces sp. NPDC096136]|uniref:sensor histidine kinase n=1 Tax=Streptomyces sp. NPDC096136 TaxID=3366076 RepID=UPI0038267901
MPGSSAAVPPAETPPEPPVAVWRVLRRPLRFLGSWWPWRCWAYLGGGWALGYGVLCALVLLLGLGVLLAVAGIGLVLLVGAVAGAVPLGELERRRLRWVEPEPVGDPHTSLAGAGAAAWLRTRLRERATWREFGYALLFGAVFGAAGFGVLALLALSLMLAAAPVIVWALAPEPVMLIPGRAVAGPLEALGGTAVGLAGLVLAAYAGALIAGAQVKTARLLLGPREEDARVLELTRSRVRLVEAFEAERRRIERDLHDGAQQQLVALSMTLGLAERELRRAAAALPAPGARPAPADGSTPTGQPVPDTGAPATLPAPGAHAPTGEPTPDTHAPTALPAPGAHAPTGQPTPDTHAPTALPAPGTGGPAGLPAPPPGGSPAGPFAGGPVAGGLPGWKDAPAGGVPPVESAAVLVRRARGEAKLALSQLRDLVRGMHPQVLTDHGLAAAVAEVALRHPVPVTVDLEVPRLPEPVEVTAYFTVTEALANAAKHSGASRVAVAARVEGDRLTLTITDDGRGGADPGAGAGLAGLADRVAMLRGRLTVSSPVGGPTRLRVEVPCSG